MREEMEGCIPSTGFFCSIIKRLLGCLGKVISQATYLSINLQEIPVRILLYKQSAWLQSKASTSLVQVVQESHLGHQCKHCGMFVCPRHDSKFSKFWLFVCVWNCFPSGFLCENLGVRPFFLMFRGLKGWAMGMSRDALLSFILAKWASIWNSLSV